MRDEYTVAAIQMISGSDVQANLETARGLIAQAADAGAELVALPEYFCLLSPVASDKVKMAEVEGVGPIQDFLSATAKDHGIWLAGGSIPLRSPDPQRVFNAQLVYAPDGSQVARYDKIHLFSFSNGQESYDESLGIVPGERVVTIDTLVGRIGLSICYDLRFPELYRSMGLTNLILVPSAFTQTTGKAHWEVLLRSRAIENQAYVLAPAQGGLHSFGRQTYGHSMLIDPWGDVVGSLGEGEGVLMGKVQLSRIKEVRQALPALNHRVIGNRKIDE
jgi:nitrilase